MPENYISERRPPLSLPRNHQSSAKYSPRNGIGGRGFYHRSTRIYASSPRAMNPGLRAGTLELISSWSGLKHVTDLDESLAINCDQRAIIEISPRFIKDLIRLNPK